MIWNQQMSLEQNTLRSLKYKKESLLHVYMNVKVAK